MISPLFVKQGTLSLEVITDYFLNVYSGYSLFWQKIGQADIALAEENEISCKGQKTVWLLAASSMSQLPKFGCSFGQNPMAFLCCGIDY